MATTLYLSFVGTVMIAREKAAYKNIHTRTNHQRTCPCLSAHVILQPNISCDKGFQSRCLPPVLLTHNLQCSVDPLDSHWAPPHT